MSAELERKLEARWDQYQHYLAGGASYSALVTLGEIANILRNGLISGAAAAKWRRTLDETSIPLDICAQAVAKAKSDIARLRRILSVGTKFLFEEDVLLVTMRVELEIFSDFMRERGTAIEFDLESVDCDLRHVARSRENAKEFRSAQAACGRNWGLPLRSAWLNSVQ
jgi:hypothetical protein